MASTAQMEGDRETQAYGAILDVVVELLESGGYDAVHVRTVAKRARVSLTTLYKFFPTLDALIVAAIGRWIESKGYYSSLADPPRDASLFEGLTWVYRRVLEPWVENPRMLQAYHRAKAGLWSEQLDLHGMAAAEPVARVFFAKVDPAYAKDVEQIVLDMVWGVVQRFARGELAATDILPLIERALFRLTSDNAALAAPGGQHHGLRAQPPRKPKTR